MVAPLLTPFVGIALLLAMAAAIGLWGLLLRQPLIVSFIAVGLAAGPSALDVVHSEAQIDLLAELGVAILLFLVGIKLDVKLIRSLGAVSLMTGLGQVVFTSVFGYMIALALGLDHLTNIYVAVALTFSSTIIIVKLLSDRREIDLLHGQIALGFLIVQDLVVVLAMIVLSAIGIGTTVGGHGGDSVASVLASAFAMVGFVALFVRFVATPLIERLARTPELPVIFAIAQAAMFAAIGKLVGLGKEVGGLLAGVSLASTPYREAVAARLAPMRDFLLLFFFIALGATLALSLLGAHVTGAIVFSLFVLIGNPLIVHAIMGAMGYRKRTGFLAALTFAQISEFSLILVAMGVSLGHVREDALGLVTMIGLVTIGVSAYMITYSHRLFAWCEPLLGGFERKDTPREPDEVAVRPATSGQIVLFGLGRFGSAIGPRLHRRGMTVLGVDWIVSTIPQLVTGLSEKDSRRTLIQLVHSSEFRGRVAVTSHTIQDTRAFLGSGADMVLEPFQDAADLVCGGRGEERTEIPDIETEGRIVA